MAEEIKNCFALPTISVWLWVKLSSSMIQVRGQGCFCLPTACGETTDTLRCVIYIPTVPDSLNLFILHRLLFSMKINLEKC